MAVICKAVDIIKNTNGATTGYVLSDTDGNVMSVPSDKIKTAILTKQVIVSNLKVTSNNRLIQEDIDVSNNFIAIAKRISDLSGVKYSKPCIEDFYFYTRFENTPAFLLGRIDDSEVTFCVKDKNVSGQINANTIARASALVKKMYCDYITECKPVDNEIGTPKKEENTVQHRIITIDTSEIHYNQEKIAEKLGIEWVNDEKCFRIVDENAIVVVNLCDFADISFFNSKVHGFKIIGNCNSREGILLKYCEMQYLESKHSNPQIMGSIIYDTAIINDGTITCYSLTYINVLKLNDYRNIDLDYILANKVYVNGNSVVLETTGCAQYIKQLEAYANDSIQIIGDSWTVENMKLTAENVRFSVNQHNKNTEYQIQSSLRNLNGKYTYPNLYMIVCNHFLDANSVVANIDVSGNIRIGYLVWKCKFNTDIKIKASSEFDRTLNAEFIQDSIPTSVKISMGGVAITDNTDITFVDLKIGVLHRSRTKGYSLGSTGIFLTDESIKNFSITIANSLKPATKNTVYDLNLVIKELKKISKINPIKVYYGTQAYEILTTNGVEVDILNKEVIGQNVKNTYVKEKIIGVTVFDTIERAVSDAIVNTTDSERYEINTGINVELPSEIIETYGLNIASGSNTTISTGIKSLLDILELFPANNLPFTTDVLNKVTSDTKFRVKTELIASCENIMVNLISITYTGMLEIDQYVVVTNGKNLIYMTYIGDCELKYYRGSSLHIQDGVQAIRKLDSVDLVLKSIRQSVTISSVSDTNKFIQDVYDLFNKTTVMLLNSKTSSILTLESSRQIVSFKVGYKKVKKSKFDANYERNYLHRIEKIESNDNVENIIDDVNESYKNSVLLRTKDIKATREGEVGNIPSCEVSSLWQIAHKHSDIKSRDIITIDLLNDVLKLGFFNNITEAQFIQALKKASRVYRRYVTDGSFDIESYSFTGKLKRLQSEYMGKITYLHVITFNDGSAEYYSADESIDTVIAYIKRIAFNKNSEQFESYVTEFNVVKDAYGYKYTDADKIAYNLQMSYKDIRYKGVSGIRIYTAIKDAENNHDYDRKLALLRLIGMSEYEYDNLISKGTYYNENDRYKNIDAEVIVKMPKSKELLDLLQISDKDFDELVALDKYDKITYKLKHIALDSVVVIYSSLRRLQSTYKGYSTKTVIGVCKKTGYCYLFTINGGYVIPALRITSFKEAMLLRKQLIEEEAEVQKKDGLLQDIGWNHSDALMQTIELNLTNTKEADKYPQKYRHLVAYFCEEPEFENMDTDYSQKNTEDENSILSGYTQAYLMQFMQMGAVQMVVSIPSSYKYRKTYLLEGVGYKAIEYYNPENQLYAFSIGSDTNVISEYSLEELFD